MKRTIESSFDYQIKQAKKVFRSVTLCRFDADNITLMAAKVNSTIQYFYKKYKDRSKS